jgi:hypothetical protein
MSSSALPTIPLVWTRGYVRYTYGEAQLLVLTGKAALIVIGGYVRFQTTLPRSLAAIDSCPWTWTSSALEILDLS